MKVVKAIDVNGKEYKAYEGHTKTGIKVHLDKAIADLIGPEEAMAMEIAAHERDMN